MDERIFLPEPMELLDTLLNLRLEERIGFDGERNMLFLNFEGMHVRTRDDVDEVRQAVEARCAAIGKRVNVVVNYDAFKLDDQVADVYADMVRHMEENYYSKVSRYTTSAFLRVKLGQVLTRRVAPHLFESRDEAQMFLREGGN